MQKWLKAAPIIVLVGICAACANTIADEPKANDAAPIFRLDNAEIAARIDAYFAPLAATSDFSGTLRLERRGAPPIVRHYGYADWPRLIRHRNDTIYSAASVTKGIVAATLVTLVRDGEISLDMPIGQWLSPLKQYTDISIRTVLEHRAGLPRDFPDDYNPVLKGAAEWLAENSSQITTPGEERYSNIGYALLAEVIAAATEQSFADAARTRVLIPLEMQESMIAMQTADKFPRGALPYAAGPDPVGVMTPTPTGPAIGSSGLVTTASDLARWARALIDDNYPELFESEDPLGSIGKGTDSNGEYVSLQGSLPGYAANAIAWREQGLTFSFMGNLMSYPAWRVEGVLRALVSDNPPPAPETRPPTVQLSDGHRVLAGNYQHPDFGLITLYSENSQRDMMLTMPDRPAAFTFYLSPLADSRLHWRVFDTILVADGSGGLKGFERTDGDADRELALPSVVLPESDAERSNRPD